MLEQQLPKAQAEEREAQRDLRDLLELPSDRRISRIRRSYRRFRTPALAQLLIAECRKRLTSAPHDAYHFADLAREVTNQLPGTSVAREVQALALGEMANAIRAVGDLPQSDRIFGQVRHLSILGGVSDPMVLARLDSLEGSLRFDQCRYREAEEVLKRSRFLYDLVGDRRAVGKVMMKVATVHYQTGKLARAVGVGRETVGYFDPEADGCLYLAARRNLAAYLADEGSRSEALAILDEDEARHRALGEPLLQIRYTWIRGKIALGQKELGAAERSFLAVRDVFLNAGIGFDAALVSLDLAHAFLAAGRTADTKRIATEIVPLFEANEVHREALAALLLFGEAADRETLTVNFLGDLGKFLEASRADPSLRFEPGRRPAPKRMPEV